MTSVAMDGELRWLVGSSIFVRGYWQSPCTALTAGVSCQWEMPLLCNDVFHWLGSSLEVASLHWQAISSSRAQVTGRKFHLCQGLLTVPLHSPNGRRFLSLGLCKETVKESRVRAILSVGCSSGWGPVHQSLWGRVAPRMPYGAASI